MWDVSRFNDRLESEFWSWHDETIFENNLVFLPKGTIINDLMESELYWYECKKIGLYKMSEIKQNMDYCIRYFYLIIPFLLL